MRRAREGGLGVQGGGEGGDVGGWTHLRLGVIIDQTWGDIN